MGNDGAKGMAGVCEAVMLDLIQHLVGRLRTSLVVLDSESSSE
ncbi:MAG: hypothetical protein P1U47_10985 [Zhongshania sp.]|nr:hypothetical protein [Zhongshania sp.]MDF1692892.1 hypothetical protein [Zhongshania sp.]